MFAMLKRASRFENQIDASIERLVLRHKVLGFVVVFVGMPMLTLAAVCACTTLLALPAAMAFGWL